MQLTQLGPYVIDKPLGKGGMGSVYAATDPQTGQRVAIKALTPHLAAAEGFRERFEAEIESLKTLRHEGIVRLYGYGEQDGILFYSMEVVDGTSLEDELKAGRRFNWREVSSIAIQLSLALKHAHDHGIVHRDIKPANILLYDEDRVKLADFGIARLFGTTSLTTAGGVLGTADYMSPEQADGRPVTAKCDQYSLGGVMYALLAGRPPFRAKNLPQMLQMQRFANPEPVRRYAPDTPEQLEQVIMQLLSKEPAARFPNTQVLARHLQAMVNALSRPAADDFALAGDPLVAKSLVHLHESISTEVTQAEPARPPQIEGRVTASDFTRTRTSPAAQDAATMAADALALQRSLDARAATSAPSGIGPSTWADPPARFTTIEEEEERLRHLSERSWVSVAAQLVTLILVICALFAFGYYVTRPTSADKLFAAIDARVTSNDDGALGKVEREVNEFLERFPSDPRARQLREYQERIELGKLERRLQRASRVGVGEFSLLPAEQLYSKAVARVATSPDEALTMLESLVALFGPVAAKGEDAPSGGESAEELRRTADIVQLARRRIQAMRPEIEKLNKQRVLVLESRLADARQFEGSNPQQAVAMYRAILELYAGEGWARGVVDTARTRLAKIEQKGH